MAFFSQLLLLEAPRVSAYISPRDKRTETRQPPLERVSFFLSCHVNNSILRFAAIRLVFQYWVTYYCICIGGLWNLEYAFYGTVYVMYMYDSNNVQLYMYRYMYISVITYVHRHIYILHVSIYM